MSRTRKLLLWLGVLLSLPAVWYSGMSVVFYAWLEASRQWPTEKAAVWVYSFLALTVLLIALFVYCVVALVREANRSFREEQRASATRQSSNA
jgi:heme/copper-type cytochrome/quinol oxidase subunit 2